MTIPERILVTGAGYIGSVLTEMLLAEGLADGPKTKTVDWYKSLIEWHRTTEAVAF